MTDERKTKLAAASDDANCITNQTSVSDVLKADEIGQINCDTKQDDFDEELDNVAAEEEQDDELNDKHEIATAADSSVR